MLPLLESRSFDMNAVTCGLSVLQRAVARGDFDSAQLLLAADAEGQHLHVIAEACGTLPIILPLLNEYGRY